MAGMDSFKIGSIQDIIAYGKSLEISHAKLHLKETFIDPSGNTIIINFQSVLDKYQDILIKHTNVLTLTDSEFIKYRYQPKLFCLDVYQTTELWSNLLRINKITSVSEFTLQTLIVFNQDIFDVLNEIFILEDLNIKQNNSRVYGSIVVPNKA